MAHSPLRRALVRIATVVLATVCLCPTAQAVTLDWSTRTWTAGSLNNAYDIDPSRAGTDIAITVGGSTNRLTSGLVAPNPMTPAVTRAFDGGLSPGRNSLELAIDLTNQSQSLTVTYTFSAAYASGVTNVSFSLFDIDSQATGSSNFEDQVRTIYATLTNGTQIAATITNIGSSVTPAGIGLAQTLTGNSNAIDLDAGSEAGNATISFLSDNIRSISFVYGGGSTFADPTYQHIGIGDITYSPVPEINPAWTAVASCLAAAGLIFRHRANFRD
jgi:hypothetical protein